LEKPNRYLMDKVGSIFDLSAEEKLQLVEDLWDDLGTDPAAVPIHDWQKAELDARKQRLAAAPTSTLGWDEVKAQVRSRRAL
jgi:putative addiction module component (TIGR02574 family)